MPQDDRVLPLEVLWGTSSFSQSCVSSVTREIPDIDAPKLYPSISCVAEVPDLCVSGMDSSRFEVSDAQAQQSRNDTDEAVATMSSSSYPAIAPKCTPNWNAGHYNKREDLFQKFQQPLFSYEKHNGRDNSCGSETGSRQSYRSGSSFEVPRRSHSAHSLQSRQFIAAEGDGDRRFQRTSSSPLASQFSGSENRSRFSGSDCLSRDERRSSSRLLSQVRGNGHFREEQRQAQSQKHQYMRQSSGSHCVPTLESLGYGQRYDDTAPSPRGKRTSDSIPRPARRSSYTSTTLSLECETLQDGKSHGSASLDPPQEDTPPQPPRRCASDTSLCSQLSKNFCAPNRRLSHRKSTSPPPSSSRSSNWRPVSRHSRCAYSPANSNSKHASRSMRDDTHLPNNHSSTNTTRSDRVDELTPSNHGYRNNHHPSYMPRSGGQSVAAMPRTSQHSFCQDSVCSSITGPTYFDGPSVFEHSAHNDEYAEFTANRIPENAPFRRGRAWGDSHELNDQYARQHPVFYPPHHQRPSYDSRPPSHPQRSEEEDHYLATGGFPRTNTASSFGYSNSNRSSSHSRRRDSQGLELEIHPGLFLPLRGAMETVEAIKEGFTTRLACLACTANIICIADSEYVLCPVCKVVNPIEFNSGSGTGVGLGLQDEE